MYSFLAFDNTLFMSFTAHDHTYVTDDNGKQLYFHINYMHGEERQFGLEYNRNAIQ